MGGIRQIPEAMTGVTPMWSRGKKTGWQVSEYPYGVNLLQIVQEHEYTDPQEPHPLFAQRLSHVFLQAPVLPWSGQSLQSPGHKA